MRLRWVHLLDGGADNRAVTGAHTIAQPGADAHADTRAITGAHTAAQPGAHTITNPSSHTFAELEPHVLTVTSAHHQHRTVTGAQPGSHAAGLCYLA